MLLHQLRGNMQKRTHHTSAHINTTSHILHFQGTTTLSGSKGHTSKSCWTLLQHSYPISHWAYWSFLSILSATTQAMPHHLLTWCPSLPPFSRSAFNTPAHTHPDGSTFPIFNLTFKNPQHLLHFFLAGHLSPLPVHLVIWLPPHLTFS